MNIPAKTLALLLTYAFSLVGCGATSMPIGGSSPTESLNTLGGERPEFLNANGQNKELLYISNYYSSTVAVYSWPELHNNQNLGGFVNQIGLCVDKRGDVYVANTNANDIVEYRHGGAKPIHTLMDLPGYYPSSCAVDPATGDLAVTNLGYGDYGSKTANVLVFHHAKGTPKVYDISSIYYDYFCGYDNRSDLVVDGSSQSVVAFAILHPGKAKLEPLTLNVSFKYPGGIQWDGSHMAIGNQQDMIYQFDIKGNTGTEIGATTLQGANGVYGFFIAGGKVIAPELGAGEAEIYRYPSGGAPLTSITGLEQPEAAVVSVGN